MPSLDHILKFTSLMHDFRAIERVVMRRDSDLPENDVEHSFTLAMLGWFINDAYSLGMDTGKILKYALAHDLVEVYAGDTYFYHDNQAIIDSKHDREVAAAARLRTEFPEFEELHVLIDLYEKRGDREGRFVYALDKIEPILSIYVDGGRTWREKNITIDMLTSMKRPKVAVDSDIARIFEELIQKITVEKASLFGELK